MPEDREDEKLEEATDPPDNQRSKKEEGASRDSTGDAASATDPPDNQ